MTNGIGVGKMPIMPENYQSLTDMAINTTRKDWDAKAIAVETSIRQQEAEKKQQYLQQMSQAFQSQQAPNPIEMDKQEIELVDKSYLKASQNELTRMQKAYEIAALNGMTTEANMWRDNITATEKALFDYQSNIEKEKTNKITKASNALMGVTDQSSYQTALEQIRDNVDVALAQKMFKQLGPVYNAKVAQKIKMMAYSGISAEKQLDDKRADNEFELNQKEYKSKLAQDAFNNGIKKREEVRKRESLELEKKNSTVTRFKHLVEATKSPKEDKIPISIYAAPTLNEESSTNLVANDMGFESTDPIVRKAVGEAKIISATNHVPFEEALRKQLTKPEESSTPSVSTIPAGWSVKVKKE